ncbi:hypothetical protein EJ110_NYTH04955 [Nymphaea thermarum]|nr:hypothetical protein EJ110_NYTH04955 [Nymphaea thermarum]
MADVPKPREERAVCLIGDVHGYMSKLERLWRNLESALGTSSFETALIIFLGDYCDRGPDTSAVIDFLISLPSRYPRQSHVFLCGNHDFAFAAFIGALPQHVLPAGGFRQTWDEYLQNEEREGWYKGEGYEVMHVQARRWAGSIKEKFNAKKGINYQGSIYDAETTFKSYGVPHGHPDLMKAVPKEHKEFLADLVWVHEEDNVCIQTSEGLSYHKLIAVHAGLVTKRDVESQLKMLRSRDTSQPKAANLSGRKDVWDIPKALADEKIIEVSGHHGALHIDGLRLIIDESGGLKDLPLAAMILPSKRIIRDTDVLVDQH